VRQGVSEVESPALLAADNAVIRVVPPNVWGSSPEIWRAVVELTEAGESPSSVLHLGPDYRKMVRRRALTTPKVNALGITTDAVTAAQAVSSGVKRTVGSRNECRLQISVRSIFPKPFR